MGTGVKAQAASFQDFVLILEGKVFFFNGELAAGVFEASLYLAKKTRKKRLKCREGEKCSVDRSSCLKFYDLS